MYPDQAVSGPAGPAPVRPPRSARRTSSVDMTWPGGFGTQLRLEGNARDAVTFDPTGPPVVVDEARTSVGIGPNRTIEDIAADGDHPGLQLLVGCRGGGYLRAALDEHLPDERAAGTPLSLLLDDISGTSLIAGFGWSRWVKDWITPPDRVQRPSMEGVCIGFAPGSSALVEREVNVQTHRTQPVGTLVNPDDPDGWHRLPDLPDVSMRRARRIDVWRDGDLVHIDTAFQDSSGDPDHGRIAVHEYLLRATADAATLTLQTLEIDPRVLPFVECPSARVNAMGMIGTPLVEMRRAVLERLAKTNGCTHLNDALRALAEVPVLLSHLDAHT
jgi:Protein of unknown function (DUF2889)